ncbi:MAG: hypothetical protein L0219_13000 [Phycisphaerales bacterium]|nr:hypothetical protein [Phycisphaerales bacterium]
MPAVVDPPVFTPEQATALRLRATKPRRFDGCDYPLHPCTFVGGPLDRVNTWFTRAEANLGVRVWFVDTGARPIPVIYVRDGNSWCSRRRRPT